MSKTNLYFFFPYCGVGGVSVLFLRLATYLSNINLYNVFLIDYKDGYMAKNYDESSSVKFVVYSRTTNIKFEDNDVVIFQSMPLWGMPPNLFFSDSTKLIYWNLHPYNMFGYASSISKYFKNKFVQKLLIFGFRYLIYPNDRKAIKVFDKKKSIFFMDEENYTKTRELLDLNISIPSYLPLIIDDIENIKENYIPNDQKLNCIWMGRIADFKVHILLYTLKKLNVMATEYKKEIVFTIVGNGKYLDYLLEEIKTLKNIKIKYIDYVNPNNLKEFLKVFDIGFAMGTAALDFAKFGLPTVLLDFAYEEIKKEYKFDWLYNTKNFTLGREIDSKMCEYRNKSLENIITSLSKDYVAVSIKSFNYVNDNFKIESNVNKFLKLMEESDLVYSDLSIKYFDMNIFHNIIGAKKYYDDK